MTLELAIESAKRKRDFFKMDVHVLRDNEGEYYSALDINLPAFFNLHNQKDKTKYYTAWNLKK